MSREIAAIVAPAVDRAEVERRVHAAHVALQDAERKEKQDTERAAKSRDEAARRRLEMGRALMEARKAWPARGPNAKGWGEFLAKQGINQASAKEWMSLAGYVDEFSLPGSGGSEIPTRREVQEARREKSDMDMSTLWQAEQERRDARAAETQPDPADDWAKEIERRKQPVTSVLDIDVELAALQTKLVRFGRAVPPSKRAMVAQELRAVAQMIEEMNDE